MKNKIQAISIHVYLDFLEFKLVFSDSEFFFEKCNNIPFSCAQFYDVHNNEAYFSWKNLININPYEIQDFIFWLNTVEPLGITDNKPTVDVMLTSLAHHLPQLSLIYHPPIMSVQYPEHMQQVVMASEVVLATVAEEPTDRLNAHVIRVSSRPEL